MLQFAMGLALATAQAETAATQQAYPDLPEFIDSGPRPSDRYLRRVSLARELYLECAGNVAERIRDEGRSSGDANARTMIECQHEFIGFERSYRLLSASGGSLNEGEIQRALDVLLVDRIEAIESFYHSRDVSKDTPAPP